MDSVQCMRQFSVTVLLVVVNNVFYKLVFHIVDFFMEYGLMSKYCNSKQTYCLCLKHQILFSLECMLAR
jgi:hypothetical protein